MRRLVAAIAQDFRLQYRHGFYHAAAFVVLVWATLLHQAPAWSRPRLLPLGLFVDLAVIGFYFLAGMVLFEKMARTVDALVATPLRFFEYLAAKLLTLSLMAVGASALVALAALGPHPAVLGILPGVFLTSLITLLVGFLMVAPFGSLSTFLIPSMLPTLVLMAPLIPYVGWFESPLFYLIPTMGSLLMLQAPFAAIAPWQLAYAIAYQLLWIAGLAALTPWAFDRFIARRSGR